MNRRRFITMTGAYGASVVVSGLVSIAVIPAVIIAAGDQAWTTIAVSQAVAGFAFVLAVFGWGVTGPTDVAGLTPAERGRYFYDSVLSRVWLCLIIIPISVVLAIILSGGDPWLSALTTISGIAVALGAGWFFVGEKAPLRFLLLDTIPRVAGTVAGGVVLIATGDARWFAGLQLAGVVISAVLSTIDILTRNRGWEVSFSPVRAVRNLRGQLAPVTMAATTSLYVNVPIVLVQLFIPSATAVYALAERMVRLALYATRPIVQIAQSYVPAPDDAVRLSRARQVMRLALALGLVGGIAYALLGPWAGSLLSGGSLNLEFALSAPMGLNLAALLASQLTGFACLTALGLSRSLATSTIVGAVVGTVLMIPLTLLTGVNGLAWGLGLAELSVLLVQVWVLRRAFTHRLSTRQSTPPSPPFGEILDS